MQKADGMNYVPVSQAPVNKVVKDGEFRFAAVGLDHGHIFAMCGGLLEAGADLAYVYDPDPNKVVSFCEKHRGVVAAESIEQVLSDDSIQLVASACIPNQRTDLGCRVLAAGKHYFADKPAMTSFEQLEAAREAVKKSGKKYYVYFGERLHVESAVFTQQLIDSGKLGRVLQVTILAPHRLNKTMRPEWFFSAKQNGTILNDIGSHQFEQFLSYTGAKTAMVLHSKMANYANKDHPDFTDFGDVSLLADNGATGYCRVDWFTPDGLNAWGDGRVFIMGTKGTVEIRKYIDIGVSTEGDHVFFTDSQSEHRYDVYSKVGYPFFGAFILDCIYGTENSMTQEHVFEAMRIALEASEKARRIEKLSAEQGATYI